MSDLPALRERYRTQKAALFESLTSSGMATRSVGALLGKLAALTDATLKTLWQRAKFENQFA